jgi:hypothetical protein
MQKMMIRKVSLKSKHFPEYATIVVDISHTKAYNQRYRKWQGSKQRSRTRRPLLNSYRKRETMDQLEVIQFLQSLEQITLLNLFEPGLGELQAQAAAAHANAAAANARAMEFSASPEIKLADEVLELKRQHAALMAGKTSLLPRQSATVQGALRAWMLRTAW